MPRRLFPIRMLPIVALTVVVLGSCSDKNPVGPTPPAGPPPVATIELTPSADTLAVGGTLQLTATLRDAGGNVLTGRGITWASANSGVVSVSGSGLATAETEGPAAITATAEGKSARADLMVLTALGRVGSAGGAVSSASGSVVLDLPAGAVAGETRITVASAGTTAQPEEVVPGTAYRFGPEGTRFAEPAQLTIHYDRSRLQPQTNEQVLRLHKLVDGAWEMVEGSTVDVERQAVTGPIQGFSVFAVLPIRIGDLQVTMSALPDPVAAGDMLTYELMLYNAGPDPVRAVAWRLIVDGDVDLVEPDAGCQIVVGGEPARPRFDCVVAALEPGISHRPQLRVVPRQAGQALNATAAISSWSGAADPDLSNNTAQLATGVASAAADLVVVLQSSPEPVEAGADMTVAATVANLGPDPVENVRIRIVAHAQVEVPSDLLPGSCTVEIDDSPETGPRRIFTCTVAGPLAEGEAAAVAPVLRTIAAQAGTTFPVDAEILGWDGPADPDPSNNRTEATVTVSGAAHTPPTVQIAAPADGTSVVAGAVVVFQGSAADAAGQAITGAALVWTSSLGGQIGTDETFARSDLAVGQHTITLTATDSGGQTAAATVTLTISAPGSVTVEWVGGAAEGATAWNVAGNWSTGQVPGAQDRVVVPATANHPVLDADREVAGIEVRSGATLDLGSHTLAVGGNVAAPGEIRAGAGLLLLTGYETTLHGLVPSLRVAGTVSLDGATTARGGMTLAGGRVNHGGHPLTLIAGGGQ